MKLKSDYVLRQVADSWIVLALGDSCVNFNGILTLNESGALLWRVLEQGGDQTDMVCALTREYDIDCQTATADVDEFISKLYHVGCLE